MREYLQRTRTLDTHEYSFTPLHEYAPELVGDSDVGENGTHMRIADAIGGAP